MLSFFFFCYFSCHCHLYHFCYYKCFSSITLLLRPPLILGHQLQLILLYVVAAITTVATTITIAVTTITPITSFRTHLMGGRERNVLFNDALNTFYLRLYGVRHMVKDHYDSEKGNPLPPHRLLLSINSKGSFICTIPQTG